MHTSTVETTHRRAVRIERDDSPTNPREWDNLGTMACWHRRYNLGDAKPYEDDPQTYVQNLRENHGEHLILPLYLLDHSGITMSTTPFPCPWDSGQVGLIHMSYERIAAEYGSTTPEAIGKARQRLLGEVSEYDAYLRGEVYGYVIEDQLIDSDGDVVEADQIDSCWGFIHLDGHPAIEAIIEHLDPELHDLARAAWEEI
jgi:hypothetical protein